MTTIFHKGVPCDPPIVNGIPFQDRGDGVFIGDVPEGREDELLGIPAYSLEDPAPAKKGKAAVKGAPKSESTGDGAPEGDGANQ